MAFSFKLRRCIGRTARVPEPPSKVTHRLLGFRGSWMFSKLIGRWTGEHCTEVRCIINPTVGWPHGAHWLPVLAHFEWPIAHPVCTIANQSKTSTYIFSGPLYLLAVCTDTLVAWRDDLKYSDVNIYDKGRCIHDVWQGSYRIPTRYSLATWNGLLKYLNSDKIIKFKE